MSLHINEIDDSNKTGSGGERYFNAVCAKWMKWLRGALDAGKRSFKFEIEGNIYRNKKLFKKISFINEGFNKFTYFIDDDEVEDFCDKLYPS